ncbi:hypothetical protein FEE95_15735 [Maribacter algarum]|uniref:Uncharacterized protein n=1 Tax=Maribacter algarum (ex Zhang et al. 2020) TaxID=2578118 RepID=A0A5S3PNT1_9FLAO|nr:hypothetical protein [Maribacter algarum]TMM56083.1 hypothetical protein FEE95_15735 [Maribacter algarum]
MILSEPDINYQKIDKLLGEPIRFNWRNPKTVGSPGLYLKSFIIKTEGFESIKIDSKCNFEKRTEGLIVHTNYSNKRSLILVTAREINEIIITKGKEKITPIPFYLMWILLKLGVSIRTARHFDLRGRQYSIQPMKLKIETSSYTIECIANGYLFERQQQFFKGLRYGNKIKFVSV